MRNYASGDAIFKDDKGSYFLTRGEKLASTIWDKVEMTIRYLRDTGKKVVEHMSQV